MIINTRLKNVKILATTGKSLWSIDEVIKCINIDVVDFRIHLGKIRDNLLSIKNIKEAEKITRLKANIYLDLPSNRPRVGTIGDLCVKKNDELLFCDSNNITEYKNYFVNKKVIPINNLSNVITALKKNQKIRLKDGKIVFNIESIYSHLKYLLVKCEKALCPLTKDMSCNFENSHYDNLTNEIKIFYEEMKGCGLQPDCIIISFAESSIQVDRIRDYTNNKFQNNNIKYISKIESEDGVINIKQICDVSDMVMIGRGDLGVNMPIYKMPYIQEYIAKIVKKRGKKIIIATQILEKYSKNCIPTISELEDIWNCIVQECDMIMLSYESGGSPYSYKCIEFLKNAILIYEKEYL